MLVGTILDQVAGRRWDIIQHAEDVYEVNYYEWFDSIGWRLYSMGEPEFYSKEAIEMEFDVSLP